MFMVVYHIVGNLWEYKFSQNMQKVHFSKFLFLQPKILEYLTEAHQLSCVTNLTIEVLQWRSVQEGIMSTERSG